MQVLGTRKLMLVTYEEFEQVNHVKFTVATMHVHVYFSTNYSVYMLYVYTLDLPKSYGKYMYSSSVVRAAD